MQQQPDAGNAETKQSLGICYYQGDYGLTKDVPRAIKLLTVAAEHGSLDAHYSLGLSYDEGDGVEEDVEMAVNHYELAAKAGHLCARHNLGGVDCIAGEKERALRQWMISAKMGCQELLNKTKDMCKKGDSTKGDYLEALVGFLDATDETKSPQREEAKAFFQNSNES